MKRVEFLYRDGDNYKFFFTKDTDRPVKVGDELTYEELGLTQESFHDMIGYAYDPASDHNILECVAIEGEPA